MSPELVSVLARIFAAQTVVAGMQAHDAVASQTGAGVYSEEAYNGMALELQALADRAAALAN